MLNECLYDPPILNKYFISIQFRYISMTYAIVFIYQQQTCVFATVLAFLNFFIAPEYRIIEKSGWGNYKYLFLKFVHILIASKHYFIHFLLVESKFIPCYAVKKLQNLNCA